MLRKIEEVTRVPSGHYESFQVLKYGIGQRYTTHHDYGREDVRLACGPRILTFFLYLSDVEEGGETVGRDRRMSVDCSHSAGLPEPRPRDPTGEGAGGAMAEHPRPRP